MFTASIEYIADKLEFSPRYLSDSLKTETGKSALQYIHLFLINEAKNLLLQDNLTVEKIALNLGFDYSHYFSRLFKKKVGISPTEYRKQFMYTN
ncbi:MAG: helix-turn-helix transcriptional regulator [Spirochaetota bacterium]